MKNFLKKQMRKKSFRFIVIGFIAGLALWNANSLVTGKIGTMFVPREISKDYYVYREFINSQDEYFRVLGIPVPSKWMVYTNKHPKMSLVDLTREAWQEFAIPHIDGHPERNERWLLSPLEQDFSERLLDVSAIRYIAIPRDDAKNADDFFGAYGERKVFLAHLDAMPFLHRIDAKTGEIIIYENPDARPHIYLTNEKESIEKEIPYTPTDFQFISPSQYNIKNITLAENLETYLNFSESYHPDWKIRVGDFSWWDSLWDKQYFLSDEYHIKNDAGLNSFILPEEVLKSEKSLTLFFRPQAHLYLGLIFSSSLFFICIGYLLWVSFRFLKLRKKPKK
ncbi:MAG: hypothetical protein IPN70_04855 [Candidatus Moraniibacteriota bacterium]|nr:MAG: hypothetical protein IPN70_04855 [Candidatus Moranbacteria bacterium]